MTEVMAAEPLYYAKHGKVWKRPVEKEYPDGTKTVTLGFPICSMHEVCEGQEEAIAEMLNHAEQHATLLKALEEAKADVAYDCDKSFLEGMKLARQYADAANFKALDLEISRRSDELRRERNAMSAAALSSIQKDQK